MIASKLKDDFEHNLRSKRKQEKGIDLNPKPPDILDAWIDKVQGD